MPIKLFLPKSSQFFLISIIFLMTSLMITCLLSVRRYVWSESRAEGRPAFEALVVDNHSVIMSAAFLLNGFSLLTLRLIRICSSLSMPLTFLAIIHALMNAVSLTLSLSPIYVLLKGIVNNRVSLHLYSIHCWIGVTTIVVLIIQFSFALGFYAFNYIRVIRPEVMETFRNMHLIVGYSLFYLLALSAVLGISEMNAVTRVKFPKHFTFAILYPNLMAISIVFFGLLVFYFVFWQKRIETALAMIRDRTSDEKQRFMKRIREKEERKRRIVIHDNKRRID